MKQVKEKTYTPREVAQMCKAYRKVCGGFNGSVDAQTIQEYEATVPKQIRDEIYAINTQERSRLKNILSER